MEFLQIEYLKKELGYSDIRSIRLWLGKRNVELIKIGLNYVVLRSEYETCINQLVNQYKNKTSENITSIKQITTPTYTPQFEEEKNFLNRLSKKLGK